jgi:ribosomal protein S18 acetylase RimI-like enzyme
VAVRIEVATRRDLLEVAALLATTMEDDAIFLDVIPPRERRREAMLGFFEAYALTYAGPERVVDIARRDDGVIVGAATWAYNRAGRDSRFGEQLRLAPRYLRALGPLGVIPPYRVQKVLERHRPLDTHWFLSAVGVLGAERDSGIGTELVGSRLGAIDQAHEDAYVESSTVHDRRFFERLGFIPGSVIEGLDHARPVGMFRPPVRRLRRYDVD